MHTTLNFGPVRIHTIFVRPAFTKKTLLSGRPFCSSVLLAQFFTSVVTAEVYQGLFQQFIALLEIEDRDYWFQQDSTPAHMTAETLSFLADFFHKCIISVGHWPARIPDLLPQISSCRATLKPVCFRNQYIHLRNLNNGS